MSTSFPAKKDATKNLYVEMIIKIFSVPDKQAKELASQLYDQILAHGGNPYNAKEIETTIRVIVGSWINDPK